MRKLICQIIKFGGVGGLCFLIDFLCLYLLADVFCLRILLASAIAFAVSVIINYYLSVKFVFDVDRNRCGVNKFVMFIVFSIIGLILTEIIMGIGVHILFWNYMFVKILSTAIVMVFNFITRKMFLEKATP